MNQVSDRRDLGVFIPSFLDDYGLNPDEFRVYAHIARRAGSGECFESVMGIAKHCQIHHQTVRKVIQILAKAGLILVESRSGKSNLIILTGHSQWTDRQTLEQIRAEFSRTAKEPLRKSTPTKPGGGTPTKVGSPPLRNQEGVPLRNQEGHPYESRITKDIPLRESQEGTPPKCKYSRAQESEISPRSRTIAAVTRQEEIFKPLPGWRKSRNRNDFAEPFVNWLAEKYLPSTPHYEKTKPTIAQAKAWIARKEFDEQGLSLLEIQFEAFLSSQGLERSPQYAEWVRELDEMGSYDFAEKATSQDEYKARLKFAQQVLRERQNAAT